ncbi:helix-turn-helix transcriptional regulator [Flavobacterium hercynium]|uniref:HTH araC/xylS-type domain-containing protein n=1 Tax=Flavobacterium hercynium TaxID=387094 RepID=A0A226GRC5_9FLAO|nr:AraC family transcriptional regulator [Flavobacterium hercynium]OXA84599.1 hypothetical protein B0A66_20695 [Flavobacterium hercynium]SMP37150.1 AraC-type DNA-binding protein [Flavobacterium hercynium]
MKNVTHHYGVELDWVEPLALQLEGRVEGNFMIIPDHIQTGYNYFLNCGSGISALYLDTVYHSKIHFRQENKTDDFIGLYYNLTEGEAILIADNQANTVGRWNYNLAIIDSSFSADYIVQPGTHTFALCIFIKKSIVKQYFVKNSSLKEHADQILDSAQNTIIKHTRMSVDSHNLLMELRSKTVGGSVFDLYLKGIVQNLLADYIEKMSFEDLVIDKINENDFASIMKSQSYLVENLDQLFPSIEFLAQMAHMSESKYKSLFKKITGITPNAFFLNNKLLESKRLLQLRHLTIAEIAYSLNFTNSSYFTVKFKDAFGMSPKDFIKQLI